MVQPRRSRGDRLGFGHGQLGVADVLNFADVQPASHDLTDRTLLTFDVFDFLDFTELSRERAIEQALTDRLQETLAELCRGFAFVGRQVRFDVAGDEFFVDLLTFQPNSCGTWWSS